MKLPGNKFLLTINCQLINGSFSTQLTIVRLFQADYFTCIATIVFLRKENCLYQACPTQDCNKKVVDQQNGMFRCEKCDKEFPNFKYRLILSVREPATPRPPLPPPKSKFPSDTTQLERGKPGICNLNAPR